MRITLPFFLCLLFSSIVFGQMGGEFDSSALRVTASADFLLVRPQVTGLTAYAEGVQTATTLDTVGREFDFSYDAGLRAQIGVPIGDGLESILFQYTLMEGSASMTGSAGPGQFIVDPFGNLVGNATIIDPSDARFTRLPPGTQLSGGDSIQSNASIRLQAFDIDYSLDLLDWELWRLQMDVGARLASIEQDFRSVVTRPGNPSRVGMFSTSFWGAGPRIGFAGERRCHRIPLSAFASVRAALLLGEQEANRMNTPVVPPSVDTRQVTGAGHQISVIETEVGAKLQITDSIELSAAWFLHAWNNLATFDGSFDGFFAGSGGNQTVAFDGLTLRAVYTR